MTHKIWCNWLLALGLLLSMSLSAQTLDQTADADQAKALLAEAVSYYQQNGEKALAVFSRQGPFVKGDLYVYVINTMLASGGPSVMLIGRDIHNTIDDDLKKSFQAALSAPETGTV